MNTIVCLLLLSIVTINGQELVMWGMCPDDMGTCATCTGGAACQCSSGQAFGSQPCLSGYCMRCVQFADGSLQSQVASLRSTDCPATMTDMINACSQPSVKYESVYDIGQQCIDKGTGVTLNCKSTVLRRSQALLDATPEPSSTTAGPTARPEKPAVSAGGIIAIVTVIAALAIAGAVVAFVVYRRRTQEEITIRSPLKKNEKKSTSTAELEAAVNDLI